MIDARRLALMKPTAWIVNLGRGRHIVTDDLVAALRAGTDRRRRAGRDRSRAAPAAATRSGRCPTRS